MAITQGTWNIAGYNIPDFGLTEKEPASYLAPQTFVNPLQTQQPSYQEPVFLPGYSSQGDVRGLSSIQPYDYSQAKSIVDSSNPTPTPSGTQKQPQSPGVDWSKGLTGEQVRALGMNPDTMTSTGGLYYGPGGGGGPSQDEINKAIDDVFGGNESYFGQLESNLRGDFPRTQQEIEAQFNLGKQQIGTATQSALNKVGTSETEAGQRKAETDAAARKLYNELVMGGRQRYGGASSAGQAFSELNAVEQQRRAGENAKLYTNTMKELAVKKSQIEQEANNSIAQHTLQRDMALTQAQRDFDNKMAEIGRMRAANNQAKAEARLQALYDLRNQMYQIQLENQQFENTIKLQKESRLAEFERAQSVLDQYATGAGVVSGNFANLTTTNPTSSLTPGNVAQTGANAMPTGRVSRDEDLVGSIFNTPRREELNATDRLFANTFRF